MAPPGYHGRYLRIDLARGASQAVPLSTAVLRRFIGGAGLGVYLMLREGAANIDPLVPAAPIAFVLSPLVGSPLTTSAKFAVVSRSPLTDRINDSLASSGFALAAKRTGYDALVLVGKADRPSVLIVDNGRIRVEPAGDLWGMTTGRTAIVLADRLAAGYQLAVIGPAGERQVRFATISHDGRHAGRGGSGAVLGAKNLKAIAVRGDQPCRWADRQRLIAISTRLSAASFGPATAKYRELGTASNLLLFNRLHTLPTRNFQQGSFAGAERLAPETLGAVRDHTRAHCAACTIGCEHLYALDTHPDRSKRPPENDAGSLPRPVHDGIRSDAGTGSKTSVRLEYENLFALGPLCGIDDPDAVLRASHRCDELGIDTISAGGTIAFAMECVERGLFQADWLRFGDADALLTAVEKIAYRRAEGDLLAGGSRRLALRLGGDCLAFAPQVKGLELPGYEPRSLQTMGLGLAVATRGADHNRSGAYDVDFSPSIDRRDPSDLAVQMAVDTEDRAALIDSLILCKFLRGVFTDFYAEAAEMLMAVTGWDVTADQLRHTARRIVTAKKHFNILAGWQPSEDTLPQRFFREALADDPQARLPRERFERRVRDYNTARGWSPEGWIPAEQIDELELE